MICLKWASTKPADRHLPTATGKINQASHAPVAWVDKPTHALSNGTMTTLNIWQQKCLMGRVPLPPQLMSQAVLQLTRMTIAAQTKVEGVSHLVFVLHSRGRFCVHVHKTRSAAVQLAIWGPKWDGHIRLIPGNSLLRITSSRRTIRGCTSPGNIPTTAKRRESVQNRKQCLESSCTSNKGEEGGRIGTRIHTQEGAKKIKRVIPKYSWLLGRKQTCCVGRRSGRDAPHVRKWAVRCRLKSCQSLSIIKAESLGPYLARSQRCVAQCARVKLLDANHADGVPIL